MPLSKEVKKYTYADYLAYLDDERWGIVDGVPYMQAVPSWQHQSISRELLRQFSNYLLDKTCEVFASPFDLRMADAEVKDEDVTNVYQPDLYEKFGVKEYWIVEPDTKLVSVFILQDTNRYGRPEIYTEDDNVDVSIFLDLVIELSTVFDF